MNKLVSAIITTHNRQDLLIRAVKSVVDQTYQNIELIVVDDASDERADELLKEFNLQYIYIPKEKSNGGNHARNIGIQTAKGEYVAFLDDDDYWLPTKIEKQVALIEEKHCGVVYCGRIHEKITPEGKTRREEIKNYEGDVKESIMIDIFTTTSSLLINKHLLINNGMFDENLRFWQEYELLIRLAQISNFYCVKECLTIYHVDLNDSNRASNKFFGWKNAVKYVFTKHKSIYKSLPLQTRLKSKLLVWKSAKKRCKTAGLGLRYNYYSIKVRLGQMLYNINCRIINILK